MKLKPQIYERRSHFQKCMKKMKVWNGFRGSNVWKRLRQRSKTWNGLSMLMCESALDSSRHEGDVKYQICEKALIDQIQERVWKVQMPNWALEI